MIALLDCNNFYASCERVFDPGLNGKPVLVLSNNDGCIIARSNEAKQLGIPMGAPVFKYRRLIEAHDVRVFSSNFALYGDMSRRIMNILSESVPDIEIYSIDEAFLDLGKAGDTEHLQFIRMLRKKIMKYTGIPVSIGAAPTKTLAKIATHLAKRDPSGESCYVLSEPQKREEFLKDFPVREIWGVGWRTAAKLENMGVLTAADFLKLSDDFVLKEFTITALRMKRELLGQQAISFESAAKPKKAICTARSFGEMISSFDILEQALASYTLNCAEKLRRQGSYASAMTVFVHTNMYRKDLPQYSRNTLVKFPPTQNSITLVHIAREALKNIYRESFAYKKAGVILMDFVQEDNLQTELFEPYPEDVREMKLIRAVDFLNERYGRGTVRLAEQGLLDKHSLKQKQHSPSYSTCWDNLLDIHAREKDEH